MKLFPVATFEDQDVCTPLEMNLELGTISQEFNGNLDLENVATSAVTSAKIARNKDWINYAYLNADPNTNVTINSGTKGEVHRLFTSNTQTASMTVFFSAIEGAIVIRGGATLTLQDGVTPKAGVWSLVFLVDGRIVWESGTMAAFSRSSRDGETAISVSYTHLTLPTTD